MSAPHALAVRPGDAPARGPLGAAVVCFDDWAGTPGVHLLYADLDLADRARLRADLGAEAEGTDDDALVVAAIRTWGDDAPDRLGGTFAYAAWDGARQAVVGAVDGLGLQPLGVAETPGGLVIGGDVRAVLAADGVPDDLDEGALAAALLDAAFKPAAVGRTFLRAIRALPPAHRLVADGTGVLTTRYWRPETTPVRHFRGIEACGAALRTLLREVTAEAIDDAEPGTVGVHLSAGIDSTAVAAFAAEALAARGLPPPTAFSWLPAPAPGTPPAPDQARVLAVADRWGMDVVWCPPTPDDALAGLSMDATREPTTMWTPEAPVRRAAAERGIRLMLSGWGGDEAISFSGRGLVGPHLLRTGRWGPLIAFALADPRAALQRYRASPIRRARLTAHPPLDVMREAALRGEHATFARPDLLRRADLPESLPKPVGDPRAYLAWLLHRGHLGQRTAAWAQVGTPLGLRYRYPLLDRRVLTFALSLPPEAWLTRRRLRRWPLREATAGLVPDRVRLHDSKAEPTWTEASRQSTEVAAAQFASLAARPGAHARAHLIDIDALGEALSAWSQKIERQNHGQWTRLGLQAVSFLPSSSAPPS